MENTVLEMLGDLEEKSQRPQLKQQFRHHADETRKQIQNLDVRLALLVDALDRGARVLVGLLAQGRERLLQVLIAPAGSRGSGR